MRDCQIYQPRQPRLSPLWQCVQDQRVRFFGNYDRQHAARFGPLRPIVHEVVDKFLACGDLHRGFARVRCPQCRLEYLLAFSCKTRGFCPSCQQRRTVHTAEWLVAEVFATVPHRHYVFSLPVALRGFFQRDRTLLKELCRLVNVSLVQWIQTATGNSKGAPGVALTLHTFGDYLNFHPHVHAIVTDGLFDRTGQFTPLPSARLRALRDIFRANIFRLLVHRKCLSPALVHKFMTWKHSGFNLFRGDSIPGTHRAELEKMAQYILRHSFSVEKMTYLPQNSRVVYHSRMNQTTRRNFEVFTASDFLAAVTQHIPEKGSQTIKYYGRYSNKSRGQRANSNDCHSERSETAPGRLLSDGKSLNQFPSDPASLPVPSRHRIPSRTWRELIKKIWNTDPLLCPKCGVEMKLIALIEEPAVIDQILQHLGLEEESPRRSGLSPPVCESATAWPSVRPTASTHGELVREPIYDDLPFGADTFAE